MDPTYINSLLPKDAEPTLQFLSFLIVLSFIPLIFVTTTPFLRIVIVMFFIRQSLGVQQSPPNIVLTGLSMILTFLVMGPTLTEINELAIAPLARNEINLGEAMATAYEPLRQRMLTQVDEKDIRFFYDLADESIPEQSSEIGFIQLVSAHILGELRISFSLGFILFIPFLVIDLVISNTLMALGMMMLSPTIISLPFKLMLFVAVDGWGLIIRGLVESFK